MWYYFLSLFIIFKAIHDTFLSGFFKRQLKKCCESATKTTPISGVVFNSNERVRNMIPNSLRQNPISLKAHLAIINLIYVFLQLDKVGKTVAEVRAAWEGFMGTAENYTWGEFVTAATDSAMLKSELQPSLGGRPVRYSVLFKALQAVDPWTPISRGGYFGIVESGDGVAVMKAGKTCPYDRTILEDSGIPTTHLAWTKGVLVPLSETGDDAWGADLILYDAADLEAEGLVVSPMFRTAIDHYRTETDRVGVPLELLLNVVFNCPEARTNCATPREAMNLMAKPRGMTQNDVDGLVYMTRQAMDRGQMYSSRSAAVPQSGHSARPASGSSGTKESRLASLFTDTFNKDELTRFAHEVGGSELTNSISGDSLIDYAFKLVNALSSRGLIDSKFFDQLESERPVRRTDIRNVRVLFPDC